MVEGKDMKKLFITQPMNRKSEEEVLKERDKPIEEADCLCDDVV